MLRGFESVGTFRSTRPVAASTTTKRDSRSAVTSATVRSIRSSARARGERASPAAPARNPRLSMPLIRPRRPGASREGWLGADGLKHPEALEAVSDHGLLALVRLDERQPQAADVVAEHVQRGLDLDRPCDDAEQLVGRLELVVDPLRALRISLAEAPDHLLHLRSDHVRVNANAAAAADLEERVDDVVVTRVEVEAELDD